MTSDVAARLEEEFDCISRSPHEALPNTPLARPSSEDELCELVRYAARERLSVLPIGRGSKLTWSTPRDVDFAITTEALSEVIAYEPGDGTLTALAGTSMAELANTVREGGHHLTPDVANPQSASLGGVLAASQSGPDRHKFGPSRHHVLGLRVVRADGRVARSGGRLVKNVTGYDLQRLYCGSFGSLCVLLEASLRLFPAPDRLEHLCSEHESLRDALDGSHELQMLNIDAQVVTIEETTAGAKLHVTLAGREEKVTREREQIEQLAGAWRVLRDAEARAEGERVRDLESPDGAWAPVILSSMPSRFSKVVETARDALPSHRMLIQPTVAEASLFGPLEAGPFEELRVAVERVGGRLRTRALELSRPRSGTQRVGQAMMDRIENALDPDGVFAGRA